MTTAIECKHDEFCDYLNGRHLGYCRVCGRTMEYYDDGEKPRDATAEFGGKCPFPYPPQGHSEAAVSVPASSAPSIEAGHDIRQERGANSFAITPSQSRNAKVRLAESRAAETSAAAVQARAETEPHQRNNFDRSRWYEQNRIAILADIEAMGPTKARKKWHAPSSTWSHKLRVWGVVSQARRLSAATKLPLAATRMARGRYFAEHAEEIERDLRAIGPAATCQRWGVSDTWLGRRFGQLASRRLWRASLGDESAEADATADAVSGEPPEGIQANDSIKLDAPAPGGNGWHELVASPLPAWSETWAPEVQVAWLRSATTLALAGIIATIKPTAAVAA